MARRDPSRQFQVDTGTLVLRRDPDAVATWVVELQGDRESSVNLADPTHLGFAYVRRMGHIVDVHAPAGAAVDAVHLGGGGLTLPRYIAATRPGSRQRVFEIDAALIDVVRRELPLERGWNIRVGKRDALEGLRSLRDASADLVVADVFYDGTTPSHLQTAEVVTEAARVLRAGGIYAVNVVDNPRSASARSQITNLRSVFAHVAAIVDVSRRSTRRRGNVVLIGSDRRFAVGRLRTRAAADRAAGRVVTGVALDRL